MSKKDFELIAGILRDNRPLPRKSLKRYLWNNIVFSFAKELGKRNEKFHSETFIKACNKIE